MAIVRSTGCWEWTGPDNGAGYGVVSLGPLGKRYVHRLAYRIANGRIPDGLVIDHLCRNTRCFNPDHLEAVTHRENIVRSPLIGAKTHCVAGHPFTPENTYLSPAGARRCRRCSRRRWREMRARRRAEQMESSNATP